MELREELYMRLQILEDGGLTSSEVTGCCKKVIELVLGEKADIDGERIGMFVTHLAMAMQRVKNGENENPMDAEVLHAVKSDAVYPRAAAFSEKLFEVCDVEFPQTEQDFLKVHLCNLFS